MGEVSELDNERRFFERQLVLFKLGSEEFGIDIGDVREIIKLNDVTKIPDTPDYVEGIINLRGKIVVIINLAKKLGLQYEQNLKNCRVIVTEMNQSILGFVVDECNEVIRLTGDKIEPAPPAITQKIKSEYLQGVGLLDNRLLILINIGMVIEDAEAKKIQNISPTVDNVKKKKILIVEDSAMMRGTLKSYIDQRKFNILEAKDGDEGVTMAIAEIPDLILLDIKLPKKDGIDVLKEIKSKYPDIPVIMETSVYEDSIKNKCLSLGAKEYLKKPISKGQIDEIMAKIA